MTKPSPELIVMLTRNDLTVPDAYRIFDECKGSKAKYWGIKEKPLKKSEMKKLISYMKDCGKTACIEVVEYTEPECLEGAEVAAECGCDILLGSVFYDSVNAVCRENSLKYMPYVGRITGRPSVLHGTAAEMIEEAKSCIEKGAYGIDLLGYRYAGDASALISDFTGGFSSPVCLAGSVDSFEKLDEIKALSPWAFTVGTALFDGVFGGDFTSGINAIVDYIGR